MNDLNLKDFKNIQYITIGKISQFFKQGNVVINRKKKDLLLAQF